MGLSVSGQRRDAVPFHLFLLFFLAPPKRDHGVPAVMPLLKSIPSLLSFAIPSFSNMPQSLNLLPAIPEPATNPHLSTAFDGVKTGNANSTAGAYEESVSASIRTSKQPTVYCFKNTLFNLEAGDVLTILDFSGRRLESIISSGNTATFKSKPPVLITVQPKSGSKKLVISSMH